MTKSLESMEILKAMTETGNPNSVSDAGVGALCARTAIRGAYLNVKINASGVDDKDFTNRFLTQGAEIEQKAEALEKEIIAIVDQKILGK
jgi:glutamate formiminotransferase/formiminotetrahydrofolate cyclodeaminase